MSNVLARRVAPERWEQSSGVVVSCDGEETRVRLAAGGACEARRAESCLVAPEPGDRVLVARSSWGESFVLAVLARGSTGPLRLRAAGDAELRVDGKLTLEARAGIEAASEGDVSLTGRHLRMRAAETILTTARLAVSSARSFLDLDRVEALLGAVDVVIDRVLERVGRSYRFVEEADQVRAGSIDYAADSTLNLHAENALVTADELVKVDAEQIQLG